LNQHLVYWLDQQDTGEFMRSSAKISESLVLNEVPSFRGSIVKRSIKDLIADKIAGLIASGILQVGDALPSERDLAASLNVSRETIRGAVQILAVRGIIEISHGTRTRVLRADVGSVTIGFATVQAINAYDIDSVHAARMLVERQVVADAARNVDAATLEVLSASLEAQSAAKQDPVRFLIADREFHVAIYRASGNPLLADFTTDLYAYMMEHRRRAVARPGAIATSYQDHLAITAALRARNPEAAVAAFVIHTERIYETTRSVLGGPPVV
jgi:DNA-binding FadR family transcriptional regulator